MWPFRPTARRAFVLSEGGLVTIYGSDGNVVDTFKVDPDHRPDQRRRQRQPAVSEQQKERHRQPGLRSDYQVDLDYTGSPFKGKADAPVVMAVFSDFQ